LSAPAGGNTITLPNGNGTLTLNVPGGYLPLSGGTMTGGIDMGSQTITNTGNISSAGSNFFWDNASQRLNVTGAGGTGLSLWGPDPVITFENFGQALLGYANNAGDIVNSSAAGGIVLRSDAGGNVVLQTGNGAFAGIVIDAS